MSLFADITFSTEAIVVITAMMLSLTGAIAYVFQLLMAAKDERIKEADNRAANYKNIGETAVDNLEVALNARLKEKGEKPLKKIAPVVPEHNSPTTQEQTEAAEMQTLRARLVAASLGLNIPVAPHSLEHGHPGEKTEARRLIEKIAEVPEKTADKVIEKLEEQEKQINREGEASC